MSKTKQALWTKFGGKEFFARMADNAKNDGEGNEITQTYATKDVATTSADGLMSSADKLKLNGLETGAEVNTIESISVDGTALAPSNKVVNVPKASGTTGSYVTGVVGGDDVERWNSWTSADLSTPSDTKNLWTQYNDKGFSAKHAEYAERATTDEMGNDLTLTVESNKVTAIGGKPISAVTQITVPQEDDKLLISDSGNASWKQLLKSSWGTVITDGDNSLADENGNLIFDDNETELWTSFNNVGFGAERAIADVEGNDIIATYARKDEVGKVIPVQVSFTINPRFTSMVEVSTASRIYRMGDAYILSGFDLISKSSNPFNASQSDEWYTSDSAVVLAKVSGIRLTGKNIIHLLNGSGSTYYHSVCVISYIESLNSTCISVGTGLAMNGGDAWYGAVNTVLL